MLLSHRQTGQTSLFKEVRVFKDIEEKVLGVNVSRSAKKCEKVLKRFLPFSCCPLVILWFRSYELQRWRDDYKIELTINEMDVSEGVGHGGQGENCPKCILL